MSSKSKMQSETNRKARAANIGLLADSKIVASRKATNKFLMPSYTTGPLAPGNPAFKFLLLSKKRMTDEERNARNKRKRARRAA